MVFEASGSPRAFDGIFGLVRPGGCLVLVGMPVEPVAFDVVSAAAKEIRIETIFRYDGAVLKFLGDGVLAAFGLQLPRDDDAARAAAAALEIRDTLAAVQEQVPAEERVRVSIGMHYGRVVSGNVGHENRLDFTIIGDAVNLASRLQGLAEPGQILVSEALKERLGDEFLLSNRGEVRVKGRIELTKTYQLEGLRPDDDR